MRPLPPVRFSSALLLTLAGPALAVSIEQIPNPRPAGWVTDLTGVLPAETRNEINRLGDEVKASTGAELAVVVVGTTGGAESHDFATRLFNAWGIGEAGKDNGILVFAALDDRAVDIVLGDGLTHGSGVQESAAIVNGEMIPRFRQGDPAGALLAGARACARRILDVAPSAAEPSLSAGPVSSPPATAPTAPVTPPPPPDVAPPLREPAGETEGSPLVGFGVLGSLLLAAGIAVRFRTPRCPRCKEKMAMLNESEDDAFLAESEQAEERVGSVEHQIWACRGCGERRKRRILRFFSGYKTCPQCSARTLRSTATTLEEATYTHGGLVQVDETCANCSYTGSHTYTTAALQRPREDDDRSYSSSSSLADSSSASSSSSSSSSGSDFGGGHSSGDGASGHW